MTDPLTRAPALRRRAARTPIAAVVLAFVTILALAHPQNAHAAALDLLDRQAAHDEHAENQDHQENLEHAEHEMDTGTSGAFNRFVLAGHRVTVYPLLSIDGAGEVTGRLVVTTEAAGASAPLHASVRAEDSAEVAVSTPLTPEGPGPQAYELRWFDGSNPPPSGGSAAGGNWTLTVELAGETLGVPVALSTATSSDGAAVLAVFVPAPSLTGGGRSDVFVYAFRDGEPIHAAMTLRRTMAGMEHSTDEEEVTLVQDHLVELEALTGRETAVANRAPLAFAMVGDWTVVLAIGGETPAVVPLRVEVSGE